MAKKESGCQSGCCSDEVIESVAAPSCGCCTEKTETVEQIAATSCGCCTNDESLPQAKNETDEGCNCCSSVEGGNMVTNNYAIEGLDCGDCAAKLEKGIKKIKGVVNVQVIFASAKMKVTYDGSLVDTDKITKAVSGFGYSATLAAAGSGVRKTVFIVSGLDCADCAATLEKRLLSLSGVHSAQINFATSKLIIEHTISEAEIIKTVEQAGYSAKREGKGNQSLDNKATWWTNRRTQTTVVSGIFLVAATVMEWFGVNDSVIVPLYIVTAIIGGYHTAKSGFYGLRSLTFDMNFLMTVAIIGASVIGEWAEGATVAFLFSFGNTLQTYTMDKTRQSIRALMELAPPEAIVLRDNEELRLPIEEIVVGDLCIVKPGERIPMDGIVREGISAVNQATITGESIPVEKTAGDTVYAGTVNEHGALEIEVTKIASDSTLAKIMHLVEEAQAQKAPSQQFIDVFSKYYTPIVLIVAVGIMVIPWLFFSQAFAPWFYKGLVLLVISCPCALVISTPVSIVSAIGNSSRNGVLIKGGAYLEEMGAIQSIAFDKTGTLTYGRPVVTEIMPADGITEDDFLATAASIEKLSEHPLAAAIVEKAKGLTLKPIANFTALVGLGAQADVDGKTVYIGNQRLFEELGLEQSQYEQAVIALQQEGKTVMLMGTKEGILGMIAVADTLRDNSANAISELRKAGIKHVAMLTGDNKNVAGSIAEKLNLDSFYSELLPEDKVTAVKKIISEYGSVAMVGDGVNDAPALAVANIGIAMGVAGSDTALETADIALMSDDLGKLAYLIKLSRKTVGIIKQNISFAILIKIVFVILTFAGYVNLWLAVFADMGSSILVTLNGMRLMRKLR
ncbi:heavy metal translocating P-type ATPase [Pelosinus sp. IPA-1]|uniref:heavy metal translocating P-type ATPase n=1 Tax=Pelosinus sp. IPA-1 TaxID=3029569 RepID=UPI00243619C8|nr:heavy metal translocating P-type ATPase [Pelosinus sp. IPA-1]GMA98282.1 cadmium transporter [Pelosinus sp. IPA-1]